MDNIRIANFTKLVEGTNFKFLEAMDDLVRIRDEVGEIIFENKSLRNLISKILNSNAGKSSLNSAFNLFQKSGNNKIFKNEITLDSKLYSVKITPINGSDKSVVGYIEVYRDITEERNVIRELYRANKKLNDEMLLAKNIQKSILPKLNKIQNIKFQYGHEPSGNLSGDLFDVVEIDKDRIGVYIADVVGHSISASIMTMFIRQSIRSILQEFPQFGPKEVIKELKEMFSQLGLDVSQYFSIIFFVVHTNENKLCYVNAGHNCMPILFNDEKVVSIESKGKFISNLFKNVEYEEKSIEMKIGDKIMIYTDGLTETMNKDGEFFDEDKLLSWIDRNKSREKIVESLLNMIREFRYQEQTDDVAVLYLEIGS